jgi:hypothetical protein
MDIIEKIKKLADNGNYGWGKLLYQHYLKDVDVANLVLVKDQIFKDTGIEISTINLANKRAYYKKKYKAKASVFKGHVPEVTKSQEQVFTPDEIQQKATEFTISDISKNSIQLPEGM